VTLFERQPQGLMLTPEGEKALQLARRLLQHAQDLKDEVSRGNQKISGRIVFGSPPSLRTLLTVPLILRLSQQAPDIQLVIREGSSRSMRDMLARGEIDFAIVSDQEDISVFQSTPLISESLCLVSLPSQRMKMNKPVLLTQVAKEPLILTSSPNSLRTILDNALRANGLSSHVVVEADTVQMTLELIRRGLGSTVLSYCAAVEPLEHHLVSACPIKDLRIRWVALHAGDKVVTRALKFCLEMLQQITLEASGSKRWITAQI
jgi:LysR family transcriptional regulator, nitrogen assimilation regulatory protein